MKIGDLVKRKRRLDCQNKVPDDWWLPGLVIRFDRLANLKGPLAVVLWRSGDTSMPFKENLEVVHENR